MSLPQFTELSPGTITNRRRADATVSKCYDAPTKVVTLTVGGTATAGEYSFEVNGIPVSFTRDGEANAAIALGLTNEAKSNDLGVFDLVSVSLNGLVLRLEGRTPGDTFDVTNVTAPAPGTLDDEVIEDGLESDIELGIGVVLVAADPGSIRRPQAGDTKIFGVLVRGPNCKPSTGDDDDEDGYTPSSATEILRRGPIKVRVEGEASAGDTAYCRVSAETGKVQGEFRSSTGAVSQVTQGDVEYNGTDQVGLTVDDLDPLAVASDTSDDTTATALAAAWNASPAHRAVAVAAADLAGSTSLIVLTFLDDQEHTVEAYSPATATVSSIENTTDAVQGAIPVGEFETDSANGLAVVFINLPAAA